MLTLPSNGKHQPNKQKQNKQSSYTISVMSPFLSVILHHSMSCPLEPASG